MNQPPKGIQEYIHSLEEGAGRAWLIRFFVVLFGVFIGVVYHLTEFRNLVNLDAMDQAQVARSLSRGEGFSTKFIRPLSLHLLQEKAKAEGRDPSKVLDGGHHPDLANPPLYPAWLALWMRLAPFRFDIPQVDDASAFTRYQPDVMLAAGNLLLFLVLLLQTYVLGRRLFDPFVAGVSTAILFTTELLWKFTYSGLSTLFLMVLGMGLFHVLVSLEKALHPAPPAEAGTEGSDGVESAAAVVPVMPASTGRVAMLAVLAGVLAGALAMTRYSAGVLILPVLGHLLVAGGGRRWLMVAAALGAFVVVVSPWLWRNHQASGAWFGTAGYALYADTPDFPDANLERSQTPDLAKVNFGDLRRKLVLNLSQLVSEEVPRLGGGYVTALFLVGLLIPFQNAFLQRLRWLTVAWLVVLLPAQALGRTHLTTASPVVNGENLIVLLVPPTILFAASLFSILLDRIDWLVPQLRRLAVYLFVLVINFPMLLAILPPRTWPVAFPPYHPLFIQRFAYYMETNELMMSDMPWAVAWYGNRECLWLTLRVKHEYQEDFYRINDHVRSVRAIYLSSITADERWRPKFLNTDDPNTAWYRFYMDSLLRSNMPTGFPLRHALGAGFMTEGHFFLSDRPRWRDWSMRVHR